MCKKQEILNTCCEKIEMGYKKDIQNGSLCYSTEQYNANMSAKMSQYEKTQCLERYSQLLDLSPLAT